MGMNIARRLAGASALAGLAALGACSKPAPPVNLHEAMVQVVAPQAQVLWDTSNRANNDAGEPDATKLTTEDWGKMLAAGKALGDTAQRLAEAKTIAAVAPGEKIQDEGSAGAAGGAQVQQYIDKDRAGFTRHAGELKKAADDFVAASNAKDARKLADASNGLDQICEACHLDFWYPQQKGKQ